MSTSLPTIQEKGSTNISSAEVRRREQRRAAGRVCGSAISHDGYLQMLQSVRRHFLGPVAHTPGSQLPPILNRRARPAELTTDGLNTSRFSEGLDFQLDGTRITVRQVGVEERQLLLFSMEEEERQYLVDTEVWERRVLSQMMVVSYVTFVLRGELDELQYSEREQRVNIVYEEEKERYRMNNESEISKQLSGYKVAMRAKAEKQRRLEEADVLYPTNGFGCTSYSCHPPRKEPDARNILKRYVRMKHSLDAATAISSMSSSELHQQSGKRQPTGSRVKELQPLPVCSVPLRNTLRNAIGIAAYVDLLEKDAIARKMIAKCENEEFEGIITLFREQMSLLWVWRNKRMHLKRLLYWKEQRDGRREQLQLALQQHMMSAAPRHASERDMFTNCETEGRERICIEEEVCRRFLQKDYTGETFRMSMNDLDYAFELGRCHVLEDEAVSRQVCLQLFELALRVSFVEEWERDLMVMVPTQIVLLQILDEHWENHSNQILTIQRAVRRWRDGRLGWRATHRELGRIVQAKRDRKKIQRGLESLHAFKASLLADCRSIEDEILATQKAEREDLSNMEFQHRVIINSQEEWESTALHRDRQHDILKNIIAPKIMKCKEEEVDGRRETSVAEEFERTSLCSIFNRIFCVMKEKQIMEGREASKRENFSLEEMRIFCEILEKELDEREILRIDAEERESQREEERHFLVTSLLDTKHRQQQAYEKLVHELMLSCKTGALEIESTSPHVRDTLMERFFSDLLQLFVETSLNWVLNYFVTVQQQHDHLIFDCRIDLLLKSENLARLYLVEAERTAQTEVVDRINQQTDKHLRKLQKEIRAANVIKKFYRCCRNGEMGHSGLLSYLREAFAYKREKMELGRIQRAQRQEVQLCREKLGEEMREACLERQRSIELMIRTLETRTEPRARAEVENMESMIFNIIASNFGANKYTGDPDRVTVLLQLESYERVVIQKEWKKVFDSVFEQQKATLVVDIMASRVQRCWLHYLRRKKQLTLIEGKIKQLFKAEEDDRAHIEAQEFNERACDVVKPMEGWALLRGYLMDDVPLFLDHMCFRISYAFGIEDDEWRNRMLLLWRMRHSFFENTIVAEEAATRDQLQQNCFYDVLEQVELINDEETLRDALWNERILFLLRILVKAEREHRSTIVLESRVFQFLAAENRARKALQKDYYAVFVDPLCAQYAEYIYTLIVDEEARDRMEIERLINACKILTNYEENIKSNECAITASETAAPPALEVTAGEWTELDETGAAGGSSPVPAETQPDVNVAETAAPPALEVTAEEWTELDETGAADGSSPVPAETQPDVNVAETAAPPALEVTAEEWTELDETGAAGGSSPVPAETQPDVNVAETAAPLASEVTAGEWTELDETGAAGGSSQVPAETQPDVNVAETAAPLASEVTAGEWTELDETGAAGGSSPVPAETQPDVNVAETAAPPALEVTAEEWTELDETGAADGSSPVPAETQPDVNVAETAAPLASEVTAGEWTELDETGAAGGSSPVPAETQPDVNVAETAAPLASEVTAGEWTELDETGAAGGSSQVPAETQPDVNVAETAAPLASEVTAGEWTELDETGAAGGSSQVPAETQPDVNVAETAAPLASEVTAGEWTELDETGAADGSSPVPAETQPDVNVAETAAPPALEVTAEEWTELDETGAADGSSPVPAETQPEL